MIVSEKEIFEDAVLTIQRLLKNRQIVCEPLQSVVDNVTIDMTDVSVGSKNLSSEIIINRDSFSLIKVKSEDEVLHQKFALLDERLRDKIKDKLKILREIEELENDISSVSAKMCNLKKE